VFRQNYDGLRGGTGTPPQVANRIDGNVDGLEAGRCSSCERRRALLRTLPLLAAPAAAGRAAARAQPLGLARESAVKAAFLYKFGSFVEWPPGTFRAREPRS
jgi:hypothetical protein